MPSRSAKGDPMMNKAAAGTYLALKAPPRQQLRKLWKTISKYRWLYIMMLPGLLYFVVFRYWPLWNAQIAFKDFKPLLGVEASPFVGFEHFVAFFKSFYFSQLIGNTLIFSLAKLILGMPVAIILALCIYESVFKRFSRFVQTISYMPHFLSWVIMFGILLVLLSPGEGLINEIIKSLGGEPIHFLTSPQWFRGVVVASDVWKETGWSTIIYLAALIAIDVTLFEAAAVDGASRLQRIWHISLPGILPAHRGRDAAAPWEHSGRRISTRSLCCTHYRSTASAILSTPGSIARVFWSSNSAWRQLSACSKAPLAW